MRKKSTYNFLLERPSVAAGSKNKQLVTDSRGVGIFMRVIHKSRQRSVECLLLKISFNETISKLVIHFLKQFVLKFNKACKYFHFDQIILIL